MNARQENKFSMYLLVKILLNTFNAIWAGIPGFVLAVNEFFGKLTDIDGDVQVQETKKTGITKNKKKAKKSLIDKALEVMGALQKIATDTNDDELYDDVNFTESQLSNTRDTILLERVAIIKTAATAHAAELLGEGIDAADLTEFNDRITLYAGIVSSPTQARSNKKIATANLKIHVKDTDTILKKKLDKLMLQFKDTNPDFYDAYKNDRIVIDLGIHHTRVVGVVRDPDGNALAGVSITAVGTTLVKITDSEGNYLFKPFVPGTFDFVFEKAGFQTQTVHQTVARGENVHLDVVLEHEVFTGTVASGGIVNVLGPGNPLWAAGRTYKIKNITSGTGANSLSFYAADHATDGFTGQGSTLTPGQEEIHTVTAAEFKPYLNVHNQSPNEGSYEVTIM